MFTGESGMASKMQADILNVRDTLRNTNILGRGRVGDLSIPDAFEYISNLEKAMETAKMQLYHYTSFIDKIEETGSSTLDDVFKQRVVDALGESCQLANELFDVGMYATGEVITQTLLGEKWKVAAMDFVSLTQFDASSILSKYGFEKDLSKSPKRAMMSKWWGDMFINTSDPSKRIKIFYPTSNQTLTLPDAYDLMRFDFLKTFYDGKTFMAKTPKSLVLRCHNLAVNNEQHTACRLLKFNRMGFLFTECSNLYSVPFGFPSHSHASSIYATRSQILNLKNPDDKEIERPEVKCEVNELPRPPIQLTLGEQFKCRIEELGVDYKLVESILKLRDIYATGDLVTQVLLDEKWETKIIEFVSFRGFNRLQKFFNLLKGYDCMREHLIFNKKSWLSHWYIIVPGVHISVVFPIFEDELTMYDYTHKNPVTFDVAEETQVYDFLKSFYNGIGFRISKPDSLTQKVHVATHADACYNAKFEYKSKYFSSLGFRVVPYGEKVGRNKTRVISSGYNAM